MQTGGARADRDTWPAVDQRLAELVFETLDLRGP